MNKANKASLNATMEIEATVGLSLGAVHKYCVGTLGHMTSVS